MSTIKSLRLGLQTNPPPPPKSGSPCPPHSPHIRETQGLESKAQFPSGDKTQALSSAHIGQNWRALRCQCLPHAAQVAWLPSLCTPCTHMHTAALLGSPTSNLSCPPSPSAVLSAACSWNTPSQPTNPTHATAFYKHQLPNFPLLHLLLHPTPPTPPPPKGGSLSAHKTKLPQLLLPW